MSWLRRTGRAPPLDTPAAAAQPEAFEGAAPGLAALLKGLSEDRSLAALDLGPATDRSLRSYSRFARWIRFADLFGEPWPHAGEAAGGPLNTVLPPLDRPYDLVFAWDALDRLLPDDRPRLVEWLADGTAADAHLHLVVRTSDEALMTPVRFVLLDTDRIRYEAAGTARLPPSRLLPADVARVLGPFQVVHAFTLKTGFREYVAHRR